MGFFRTKAPPRYEQGWVDLQFERVEQGLTNFDSIRLTETNVAPEKPRNGDLRFADGVNWDPGSGAGFYGFYGGNWVKLG
jgi:hypothetical protein